MLGNTLTLRRFGVLRALTAEFVEPLTAAMMEQAVIGYVNPYTCDQERKVRLEVRRIAKEIEDHGATKIYSDFLGCWIQVA